MLSAWRPVVARAVAQAMLFLLLLPAFALAQESADSRRRAHTGPAPQIEIESPRPAKHKSHKKDPVGPAGETVQIKYRISPTTTGVTSARIEVWDRPDLLVKIPVRVAKSGEVTWIDTSAPTPTRLDFTLINPAAPRSCLDACTGANAPPEGSAITVAGEDVPPSFRADPIRVRAGSETMTVDLDGSFFTASTRVLLAEPTSTKEIWKAWEFLAVEFIDATKLRITVPWTYLASARELVLWPFNLDEVESAQGNGLPLNGTEQKTPLGGGTREIVYVASPTSPVLTGLDPAQLAANASDRAEATVMLRGSGFTRSSSVVAGRDPLEDNVLNNPPLILKPRFISPEALEIRIPASQLRRPDIPYSERGPIRVWVTNPDGGLLISEPRDIQILPTDKLPPVPRPGTILAISPASLPLMTADGPPGVEVTVIGQNFRADDSILASADESEKVKLSTQFISPTELRVSLPRELWREHRVSYRFVIVTPQGERASELYEDEDAPEAESVATSPK
jgi:hypothetical protein